MSRIYWLPLVKIIQSFLHVTISATGANADNVQQLLCLSVCKYACFLTHSALITKNKLFCDFYLSTWRIYNLKVTYSHWLFALKVIAAKCIEGKRSKLTVGSARGSECMTSMKIVVSGKATLASLERCCSWRNEWMNEWINEKKIHFPIDPWRLRVKI